MVAFGLVESANARTPAEWEAALREEAKLTLNLEVLFLVNANGLHFSFGSSTGYDRKRQAKELEAEIEENTAAGKTELNVSLYERLIAILDQVDRKQAQSVRSKRERWLKERYQADPKNFDAAMAYANVLPSLMNYKRRSICLEFARTHPTKAEPYVQLADMLFANFLERGLGVRNENWPAAFMRIAAIMKKDPKAASQVGKRLLQEFENTLTTTTSLLDKALEREPDSLSALSHKRLFKFLSDMILRTAELKSDADPDAVKVFVRQMVKQFGEMADTNRRKFPDNPIIHAGPLMMEMLQRMVQLVFDEENDDIFTSLRTLGEEWNRQPDMLARARDGLRQISLRAEESSVRSASLSWLGVIELFTGNREKAMRLLEDSMRIDPEEALGIYSYDRVEHDEAAVAAQFLESLLEKQDSAITRVYLAKLLIDTDQLPKARQLSAWFSKNEPEPKPIRALIHSAADLRSGTPAAEVAIQLQPLTDAILAGKVSGMNATQKIDLIGHLLICRALSKEWQAYDKLVAWFEKEASKNQTFKSVRDLVDEIRNVE
mgnify:CR=1 FL=1